MIEELSTGDLPQKDRLPFWNEIANRMVAPVRVEQLDGSFSAAMHRARFRNFEIISATSSPARITGVDESGADTLNLQIQHVGRSRNRAAGHACDLEEGDFLLFDPSQPTYLDFADHTQVLILRLPIVTVEERLPRLRKMAGVAMQGRSGPGALFSRFLRNAWVQLQQDQGLWADALDDVIWPMLDMAYAAEHVATREASTRDERRRALFAVIEANLCDPALDVHGIARRLGVSARYVQILFAEMATTPSAYIQHQRLELAGMRLKREGARCSITDVAFDVGFNDLSSFCRAFRRRFNVAPREYRAGVRPAQDQPVALNS